MPEGGITASGSRVNKNYDFSEVTGEKLLKIAKAGNGEGEITVDGKRYRIEIPTSGYPCVKRLDKGGFFLAIKEFYNHRIKAKTVTSRASRLTDMTREAWEDKLGREFLAPLRGRDFLGCSTKSRKAWSLINQFSSERGIKLSAGARKHLERMINEFGMEYSEHCISSFFIEKSGKFTQDQEKKAGEVIAKLLNDFQSGEALEHSLLVKQRREAGMFQRRSASYR